MNLITLLIPIAAIGACLALIVYDRNASAKKTTVAWMSKAIFRDDNGSSPSAERLHQSLLGVLFVVLVGIAGLFIIGLLK